MSVLRSHDEWIALGQQYRSQQRWGEAINAYKQALELQPDGPAQVALDFIYDVLEYRHNDYLNP
jgi:Cytochrome c biogenesis factor